ncbi:MAG TPA: cation transporter [Spirochaetaceae bacterium]|nr:cation transporter [Spirochaetaceae bacterium]
MEQKERVKTVFRTSLIGILTNVMLSCFKFFVGVVSNSVAVRMDALNNLSDALSSSITILGIRLSGRAPDRKHPLGHGRIEYLSAISVAVVVLYAGITSLIESIKKMIHPENPDYNLIALLIISASVAVKIVLGLYVIRKGRQSDSDALTASGKDALFDSIISASVLAAAIIWVFFEVSLEAPLGAIISVFIIKSGFEMIKETASELLGSRVDPEVSKSVKQTIASFPQVYGAYDLVIHNYGPGRFVGSVHIEIPQNMNAMEIDVLDREISEKVFKENNVIMTGISVYARSDDAGAQVLRDGVMGVLSEYPEVMQMHGFYADADKKEAMFDIIISFDCKNRIQLYDEIVRKIKSTWPDWSFRIVLDVDISD